MRYIVFEHAKAGRRGLSIFILTLSLFLVFTVCHGAGKTKDRSRKSVSSSSDASTSLGQLGNKAEWFKVGTNEWGQPIKYAGQAATNGRIIFTPTNGFFSNGIRAAGEGTLIDAEKRFVAPDYEYLDNWTKKGQYMRWHVWIPEKGSVKIDVKMLVDSSQNGSDIKVTFGRQSKMVKTKTTKSENDSQPWKLIFPVKKPGKYTFCMEAVNVKGRQIGKLYSVHLQGKVLRNAKLLRARWRPAAAHVSFNSSKLDATSMWVMKMRSISNTESYSPITTPFGYFGACFDKDNRTSTTMNFSMWSFAAEQKAPPVEKSSHLLAVGSPKAIFSGFGHEGTGVKLRGDWEPLKAKPKELTLALRVERGNPYDSYYGYYLDPESHNWKFFCGGNKYVGSNRKREKPLWPGSFVEVPGPPNRQRSGDVSRTVLRKGWALDKRGKWNQMDSTGNLKKAENVNKFWNITKDGWFATGMGGMEHFDVVKPGPRVVPHELLDKKLPEFLSPEKTRQLYRLPVTYGKCSAKSNGKAAEIRFELKDAGRRAEAIVYYGENDCLTFAKRKAHGTESRYLVEDPTRSWQFSQKVPSVKKGVNRAIIKGLQRKTKYFYRILVINEHGKMWNAQSGHFTTK